MSIRRNTTYNLIGAVIPLAVSLVTIPIYLDLIGEARFGVLAIAWLLLGYFGLFDLGLGRATAQRIAALHNASSKERAQTFWTALTLNTGMGALGGLLIWPVAVWFFSNIFQIEDTLRPEIQAAIPWLILAVPVATLSGVLTGALQGRERFLELNLISVSGTVLFQLIPLAVALYWSDDLGLLLPAALFARLLSLIALFTICQRHIVLGHPPSFLKEQAGTLMRFGGWVTVTSFVGPMMVILDRFIIGALSGAKAVSYYTVPFQLGERSTILSGSLVSALFPRFSAATIKEEKRLAEEGLTLLMVVMTPLVAVGILFMEPFLAWWIDSAFAEQSSRVGQIILIGFWFNGFARIPSGQLQARGRPDIVAKCHLVEVFPYLGLMYAGISLYGIVGAAIVSSVRITLDLILLASFAGVIRNLIRLLWVPVILIIGAFLIAMQIGLKQASWLPFVLVYILMVVYWSWRKSPAYLRDHAFSHLKFHFKI